MVLRGKSGNIAERPRQLPGIIRIVLGVDTDEIHLSNYKIIIKCISGKSRAAIFRRPGSIRIYEPGSGETDAM